ncbi:Mitochondrial translocator assembly and maintenance protein 41 [Globomyces sp. JEL0801]|nr:Mitochondrial translocator assembly and maintenance protein 41 [Globomyces sp. JEL0801]
MSFGSKYLSSINLSFLNTKLLKSQITINSKRNYTVDENLQLQDRLKKVLDGFNAPIRYAIAYGSGAYPQKGYDNQIAGKDTMVDFIFGVTHAEHWHSLNLRQHRNHYSFLGSLGGKTVSTIQERFGARIYYNPDIVVNGVRIKYGVVSMHHLQKDLEEWETLYLAGRFHKPIKILRDDAKMGLAIRKNLENAVRVALLMLPPTFTEEELFLKIAGLSYRGIYIIITNSIKNLDIQISLSNFLGDFRMTVGENPYKQDTSVKLRGLMLQALPKGFQEKLHNHYLWSLSKHGQRNVNREEPTFSQEFGQYPLIDSLVGKSIKDVVARPAVTQSLKGVLSAGIGGSIKYAKDKVQKKLNAKKKV